MKYIFSQEQLVVPEGVKIHIRSRIVTVEGPRGTATTTVKKMLCDGQRGRKIIG